MAARARARAPTAAGSTRLPRSVPGSSTARPGRQAPAPTPRAPPRRRSGSPTPPRSSTCGAWGAAGSPTRRAALGQSSAVAARTMRWGPPCECPAARVRWGRREDRLGGWACSSLDGRVSGAEQRRRVLAAPEWARSESRV